MAEGIARQLKLLNTEENSISALLPRGDVKQQIGRKISLRCGELKMQRRVDSRQQRKGTESERIHGRSHSRAKDKQRLQDTTPCDRRHKSSRTNLITRTSHDKRMNEKMNVKFIYGSLLAMLLCVVLAYRLLFKCSAQEARRGPPSVKRTESIPGFHQSAVPALKGSPVYYSF